MDKRKKKKENLIADKAQKLSCMEGLDLGQTMLKEPNIILLFLL